jgi:hypothetical protein
MSCHESNMRLVRRRPCGGGWCGEQWRPNNPRHLPDLRGKNDGASTPPGVMETRMVISTEKVGDLMMLRIDEADETVPPA